MAIEKVRQYFAQYGLADRILEFSESSATVALAAAALHCDEARIAKTLSFRTQNGCILVVTSGDCRIDHKYKEQFGQKARMLTPEEAVALIGHAVGGVCPFAVNDGCEVYLDQSLKRFETVFPACGSSNSAIELTPEQLEQYSNSLGWVDVCKPIPTEA